MRRHWGRWLAAVTLLGLTAGGGWAGVRAYDRRLHKETLDSARAKVAAGATRQARQELAGAARRWPGDGEVLLLLGACELALGEPDRAEEAWAGVPAGSPFRASAALFRARQALGRDRLAEAETLLPDALDAPADQGVEAREYLIYLYKIQGRRHEAVRLLQESWDALPDKLGVLRQLWQIDKGTALPVEEQRRVLGQAARSAPDDDRVRLGLADLALRTGEYAEAARLLEDCRRRRPEDPAVWRAWLALAIAQGDERRALRAVVRLPADLLSPAEVLSLRAWFAARSGDRGRERAALARLVEIAPGDAEALERLATLCLQDGDPVTGEALRARKAELDRARALYGPAIYKADPTADAPAQARRAEALGRWFDARRWWELAGGGGAEGREALGRIARDEALARSGDSLAALVTEVAHARPETAGPPAAGPAAEPGPGPTPVFHDDAGAVGLTFVYEPGTTALRQMPESMGTGVGLLDYDGDGWMDVYVTQGGQFPPGPDSGLKGDRLFRNRGDGTFEDASEASGVAAMPRGYGHGVAVGDLDNDGHPDLFVTRWRSYALLRNRGDGTFEDATERAGLGGDRDWPTSAAFADLDNDGDLDLYVCHYVVWDADDPRTCPDPQQGGKLFLCPPLASGARADRLFRNDGGTFVDVTAGAGILDAEGRGLGVVAADLDGDNLVDLFVANDLTANFLWRNRGGLRFEDVGAEAGVAASGSGGYQASMGIACGDLDGDGTPDLAVTNYYGESTTVYQNLGGGAFRDATSSSGVGAASRWLLGFGLTFIDYDNDGRLDLASANGHVDDYRPDFPHAMPAQLFAGGPRGVMADVTGRAGLAFQTPRVARALAAGDLDNDGRQDLVVVPIDGPLAYLHNRTEGGHFLTLKLEGTASNRDAVGATVTAVAGGRTLSGLRFGGGSYQSASDPRLHFGLGGATVAESVEVAWPSGRVDRYGPLPADTGYLLREGDPAPRPLPGFRAAD